MTTEQQRAEEFKALQQEEAQLRMKVAMDVEQRWGNGDGKMGAEISDYIYERFLPRTAHYRILDCRHAQSKDPQTNTDPYKLGLYNGLECATAIIELREPVYRFRYQKDEPEQETWHQRIFGLTYRSYWVGTAGAIMTGMMIGVSGSLLGGLPVVILFVVLNRILKNEPKKKDLPQ